VKGSGCSVYRVLEEFEVCPPVSTPLSLEGFRARPGVGPWLAPPFVQPMVGLGIRALGFRVRDLGFTNSLAPLPFTAFARTTTSGCLGFRS
jgi:hypothetical protein